MNFQQVSFELSAGKASQLPPSQLPEIVFSGGKSCPSFSGLRPPFDVTPSWTSGIPSGPKLHSQAVFLANRPGNRV